MILTALTYDKTNSDGAKEGALQAIKEFNEATNGSINVDTFLVGSHPELYDLCRNVLNNNPNILLDVSMANPAVVKIGTKSGIPTISATLLLQPKRSPEDGSTSSKLDANEISTYKGSDDEVMKRTLEQTMQKKKKRNEEEEKEEKSSSAFLLHFKSPTNLLLEATRDVTNKYQLGQKYLRVLYDTDYGKIGVCSRC